MPDLTPNYNLATGVVTDDFVQPEHNNRMADTLDRVLGSFLRQIITAGAHEGWEITGDKQVSPGEGLLSACWCKTATAQDIEGLTNGEVNYVFAETDGTSAPDGTVRIYAQLSPEAPGGSIYLGTLELDAEGAVVALDNEAEGVDRSCHPLLWAALAGGGTVEQVPPGGEVSFWVDHAEQGSFRLPGAIAFEVEGEEFSWGLDQTHDAERFRVAAVNEGSYPADLEYTWQREGLLR
jgi:hypothetical protein